MATTTGGATQTREEQQEQRAEAAELDRILATSGVSCLFQPVVDLDSGRPVGYEALARGPAGSTLESPERLFATAYRAGRVAELDWLCRERALEQALRDGFPPGCWLSLNAEPETLGAAPPAGIARLLEVARTRLPVVYEITERDVTARPADLLQTVNWVRAQGWRVALDDVGADDRVLALLPVVAPEVIKLDLRLVQQRPTAQVAEIFAAVTSEAERTGAVVVAEGIETEEHRFVARSLGATLGQGWLFGRPARGFTPEQWTAATVVPAVRRRHSASPTPFELIAERRELRVGYKPLLIEMSKHLERQAEAAGASCLVVAAFQHARFFTPRTAVRYERLAERVAFVAALGEGMPERPLPGVRGAALAPDDPVREEWTIAVLGPRTAGALAARDLGDGGPDARRRFAFALTYDVDLVARMVSSFMCRVAPRG